MRQLPFLMRGVQKLSATARGIYHNLKETEYIASNGELILHFSSAVYCRKFIDRVESEREMLRKKLGGMYDSFNFDIVSDLMLYRKIEKRGEYGTLKGMGMGWRQLDQYALRKMTEKNTTDWQEMQRQR